MYIVTGGAGFIGSAMVWKLNKMGIDDILVVDNLGSTEKWKNLVNLSYSDYVHRDTFIKNIIENTFDNTEIEAIFHFGACSSTTEKNADFLMSNNLEYTKTLCKFALARGIRFITASSAATYGDGSNGFNDDIYSLEQLRPLNIYGYSKHLFDLWAKKNNALSSICSLKFFNVYGPNEEHKGDMRSVVNKAYKEIISTGKMRLFKSDTAEYVDGGQLRDFIYVKDCVDIIWWLYEHSDANGMFNIGTGKARSWNDLVSAVFSALEKKVEIEYIPIPDSLKGKYQNFTQANMDRLFKGGYDQRLFSLEDGVKDYVCDYLHRATPYL